MGLRNIISRWFQALSGNANKVNEDVLVTNLLKAITNTEEVEFSCDDVFKLIDQYAEMELRGEDAETIMPLIKRHLEMCKDCHEEYEALMQVLQAVPS